MTTDDFTSYDAAYVLGALSPADRRDFEIHLKGCPACAGSVSELAGLPGLMSRVSLDQLTEAAEPLPETLLPSLARAVRQQRRRRLLTVGASAAAAACLIAVGTVAVTGSDSPTRAPVASATSTPSGSANLANLAFSAVVPSPVTASARLVDVAWGTRIDLTCAYRSSVLYPAKEVPYAMVVIDHSGIAEQVAAWKALPNRELTVVGASSRARRDIAAVEIRTLSGRTILRLST
ncbi:MAG TPA: zf-HC2 domain-containing protein [Dermatophilaceae bacterium]|jgi:Putative zinc-finger